MKKLFLIAFYFFALTVYGQNPTPFDNSIRVKNLATQSGTPDIAVFDNNKVLKKIAWSSLPSGGSQTLAQVLEQGSITDGANINISIGDAIVLDNNSKIQKGTVDNGLGGGISRICSNDKEDQWENGVRYLRSVGGRIRYAETMDNLIPDYTYNSGKGYAIGSRFSNLITGKTYVCIDILELYFNGTTFIPDYAIWDQAPIYIGELPVRSEIQSTYIQVLDNNFQLGLGAGNFYATNSSTGTATYLSPDEGLSLKQDSGYGAFIKATGQTAERTLTIPDASGTIALTSDIPSSTGSTSIDFQVPTIPAGANSAISKAHFDNVITGLTWKNAVKCSTTANQTLSGTANVDGVTVPAGTRVLVRFQTTTSQNGIYVTAAGTWTRATDADSAAELTETAVLVTSGTLYKNTQWTQNGTITTVGTDAVNFVQVAGAGTYTNGSGIDLTANVFSIPNSGVTNAMLAGSIADAKISSASTWNAKQNALNGTGFIKASGTTISYDNSTYLTTSSASSTYAPLSSPTFTGTVGGITKSMVGLGNVDNTSDANKPVSTATQTALDNLTQKSILRENAFWFGGNVFQAPTAFIYSPSVNSHTFTTANSSAGSKGMVLFASTSFANTTAFMRRHDGMQLQGLEFKVTRKIQFQTNVSGQRFFCGISKNYQFTTPTNVDQTTLTDIVGVAQLSTSTNMHVIYNDASGTATTIDLGSSYPCNDSQYNYFITIEQTQTSYIVTVERVTVSTGASITTTNTLSSNIPVWNTGVMQLLTWISNNATASIASYLDGGGYGTYKN